MDIIDLAWAGGLLEGEGSFTIFSDKNYPNLKYGRISMGMAARDLDVLRRLQKVLECGNLNGPYDRGEGKQPICTFSIDKQEDVYKVCNLLYDFMGNRRKKQIDILTNNYLDKNEIATVVTNIDKSA